MKPIKPLRERKKPGILSQAELYAQVKDSTERNRQFFFIWIAFALYVIVTTVATTDMQLLLPNSTVTLPALGIQLPLIGFFLVTPWLVLTLHFNLMQNLDSHSNKLAEWANTYPNRTLPRSALPAFLFDFAMLERGGSFPKITQIAAQIVFYAMGPITIGVLLCRFNDYQDWSFTLIQSLAFILNVYIVTVFVRALMKKHRVDWYVALFSYTFAYVPIIILVGLQFFWASWLTFKEDEPPLFNLVRFEVLRPRITIPRNTSFVSVPNDLSSRISLDGQKDILEWWRQYGVGANLAGRSLKYSELSDVDLRKVNFYMAKLQGADLSRSNLQGAQLTGVGLQDAILNSTKFQEAELEGAQLQRARLRGAQLQGLYLWGINLEATDLAGANLQSTKFRDITVNENTTFEFSLTDINTGVYLTKGFDFSVKETIFDVENTFILRENLRDYSRLKLPDLLYKQLFTVPTKHAEKNSSGQVTVVTTVGLRRALKSGKSDLK